MSMSVTDDAESGSQIFQLADFEFFAPVVVEAVVCGGIDILFFSSAVTANTSSSSNSSSLNAERSFSSPAPAPAPAPALLLRGAGVAFPPLTTGRSMGGGGSICSGGIFSFPTSRMHRSEISSARVENSIMFCSVSSGESS